MRLCTFSSDSSRPKLGLVLDDHILDIDAALQATRGSSHVALLDLPNQPDGFAQLQELCQALTNYQGEEHRYDRESVKLLPPLPTPGKVLCVAANYKAHIEETGTITYVEKHVANPWLFLKPTTTLLGDRGCIQVPRFSEKVDWELELAVVIGKKGRYIPRESAMEHIAGYTIANDVSAREIIVDERRQDRDRDKFYDWMHGKWFDTFCPMGPYFVSKDEIEDPQNLDMKLSLNGDVMQDANTSMMIFSIAELIEFASVFTTLEPGDVICTGTPSGVGKSRGRFLRPGDELVGEIKGIGTLRNKVIAEADALGAATEANADVVEADLLGRSVGRAG